MTQGENQTTVDRGAGIEILGMPAELDLATAEGLAEQGYAAIARSARLLLPDLAGLSFCDASGLSAFVRIANCADAAGCRFGLLAPRPPVAKILRISGLNSRLPVFAAIDDAPALHQPRPARRGRELGQWRPAQPLCQRRRPRRELPPSPDHAHGPAYRPGRKGWQ